MNVMNIYNKCPIFIQNILTTLQGYKLKKHRFGKHYYEYLRELEARDYTDDKFLRAYQNERVKELVSYAYNNSPFYKEFYKDIDIDTINGVEDLKKLPVLPKEVVRQNIEKMYTIPLNSGTVSNTSGTTGKSMTFVYEEKDHQRRLAYLDHFKKQHGFEHMKMKRASFNSSKIIPPGQKKKIFWRDNKAIRQRIFSGYHCKGENLKYYVDGLNQYKPDSLDGYPSAMYEVARYILDNNVKLSFTPIAIFPTAEALLPHYREAIEKAFNCKVYDQYASSEGAPFITECSCGKLHCCTDTGVIEVDENNDMLVTCFETHGTPLIRYKIGDSVEFDTESCSCKCKSSLPIIKSIKGRNADFIYSPQTGKFTSVFLSLVSQDFKNCVKNMQFIQSDINSVDIYVIATEIYTDDMDDIITQKLRYSLGSEIKLRIHHTDTLQKDNSGKFRFIINNITDKIPS